MGDKKNADAGNPATTSVKDVIADAFGPGLFLVVLPSFALFFGVVWLAEKPEVGLPVVAIFGIVILLGALALVSTLFSRLQLDNKDEALALPPGSIRAFIALSLIVLFALIAVMLFETLGENIKIEDVSETAKAAMEKEASNHVSAVIPHPCAASGPASKDAASTGASKEAAGATKPKEAASTTAATNTTMPPKDGADTQSCFTYTVYVQKSRGQESENLSKQLLILIGTLMTSVVSYYFASRSGEANAKNIMAVLKPAPPPGGAANAPAQLASATPQGDTPGGDTPGESQLDGCNVPIENPTADKDLPASTGGVAQ